MKIALPLCGGIGDHVACSVLLRNLANEGHKLYVQSRHPEVFLYNPNVEKLGRERDFVFYEKYMLSCDQSIMRTLTNGGLYKDMNKHVTKCWCESYGTTFDNIYPDFYLTKEEDQRGKDFISQFKKPTILFQPTCGNDYSPDGRQRWWNIKHAQDFIYQLEDEYDILHIKLPMEPKLDTKYKMPEITFRQVVSILKHVDTHVCVHSSIQHASAIFKKSGIVLFGLNTPEIWGYPFNSNLIYDSGCKLQPCNRPEILSSDQFRCSDPICMNHPTEMVIEKLKEIV